MSLARAHTKGGITDAPQREENEGRTRTGATADYRRTILLKGQENILQNDESSRPSRSDAAKMLLMRRADAKERRDGADRQCIDLTDEAPSTRPEEEYTDRTRGHLRRWLLDSIRVERAFRE
jgi:hypothetical protein